MYKSRLFLILALAVVTVAGSIVPAVAVAGDNLVPLCYLGRTIKVPFYLVVRYTSHGAANGPCGASGG